ncbi:BREX system P-loop protein BrxC [Pelagibaculum spongiae]|uniref:BREX system P-loop protein BrxC n=1 Tax=Pelagibaculum spongiae TaxID=2080658 RepID=A0A2V1GV54_9GAMM|nr:BREX system P-loop protein BrxC [Pelagibaculum spongiae]PVZ66778.1 BREX system P-loop protein BrxC [Pelagibaculum spongiae]
MNIEALFEKPIARNINGVIKADQTDNESIWQELDEYVITRELDIHLRKFFEAYLNAIDNPNDPASAGKVGVWVSGFFGSGKSHFIKILSYLLENRSINRFCPELKQRETRTPLDFFKDKITDNLLAADLARAVNSEAEVILFNIDSRADNTEGRDAILRVFLKVFNEKLGYSPDHPIIAHLERYLAKKGKLLDFHKAFLKHSEMDWLENRDNYIFHNDALGAALTEVTGQTITDALNWLERFEEDFSVSVDNFCGWVKEYLETKPNDHKILFLVDEIGQFIGQDTHLMLNLQTITENLGTACNGRAWVVVTSQEDIDAVVGEVRASKANDFSKIQGRFSTRLSLSSGNVDEVIQKRILGKTQQAKDLLIQEYRNKADILKNQLSFTNVGMTFKAFADEDDFVSTYPFAPYQFQLVQKVFESIRKAGATGLHLARGERSMLNAFQGAAQQLAREGKEVGVMVPLHRFYPSIESFLEGVVKSTIDNAGNNSSLKSFDADLLKTLFLIRYVDEIKGNIDNLVTLFIDQIDADRLAIKKEIEISLIRLEGETLINRSGENYTFLTNEEQDVNREIKDVDLGPGEDTGKLSEILFSDVLEDNRKYRHPITGKDFVVNRTCDGIPYGSRSEAGLEIKIISSLADDYDYFDESRCILSSKETRGLIVVKLEDEQHLMQEIRIYLQTEKYIGRKNDDSASLTQKRIYSDRAEENRERRQRIETGLRQLWNEALFTIDGEIWSNTSETPKISFNKALAYLVDNTFNKLSLLPKPSGNPQQETLAVLSTPASDSFDFEGGESTSQALEEVRRYIDLSSSASRMVILHGLVEEKFGTHPYGWPSWEIMLLVARLLMTGEIALVMDNSTLTPDQVKDAIQTPNKWRRIQVIKRKTVNNAILQQARNLTRDVFGKMPPEGEEAIHTDLDSYLDTWKRELAEWKAMTSTGKYPGEESIAELLVIVNKLQGFTDSYERISKFVDDKEDWLEQAEVHSELHYFYTSQKPIWDRLQNTLQDLEPNRTELEKLPEAATALKKIRSILKAESPYDLLSSADKLIQSASRINVELVAEKRSHALKRVDERIARVSSELNQAQASDDLKNKCLYQLQQLHKRLEQMTSIAHIFQAQTQAKDLQEQAIDAVYAAIEEAQKQELRLAALLKAKEKAKEAAEKANAAGQKHETKTVAEPAPQPYTPQVKAAPKKRCKIAPRSLTGGKIYLESQNDIDSFMSKLREEMEQSLARNERIEII